MLGSTLKTNISQVRLSMAKDAQAQILATNLQKQRNGGRRCMLVGTELLATATININDGVFYFLIGLETRYFPELFFIVQDDIVQYMN